MRGAFSRLRWSIDMDYWRMIASSTGIRTNGYRHRQWFNATKGYGFIQQDGGKHVFVHISAVERAGLQTLREGQKITFEIQVERGKEAAVNLRV